MSVSQLVTDANFLVAAAVALAAGTVSFASPCVIPLVPGYLSYMTGLSGAELSGPTARSRLRVIAGGLLFTLGFAIPFALLGLTAGAVSAALQARPWQIVLGAIVFVLGLAFTGVLPFDLLGRERRISDRAIDRGVVGAAPLGFVFAVGWVPCVGPALAGILTLASAQAGGSAARGGVLAFIYALGLGAPFIAVGLLMHRAAGSLGFLRRHARRIQLAGGVLLMGVGVAIATGLWERFIWYLLPLIGRFETVL